jgi:hypothetical protein
MIRTLATALAANRLAMGLGFVAVPAGARSWIGRSAGDPRTQVMTRAVGARDVALGAGALRALRSGDGDPRQWLAAQAVADVVDFAATLAVADRLSRAQRGFALAMAGGSAAIAIAGAVALDGRAGAAA